MTNMIISVGYGEYESVTKTATSYELDDQKRSLLWWTAISIELLQIQ